MLTSEIIIIADVITLFIKDKKIIIGSAHKFPNLSESIALLQLPKKKFISEQLQDNTTTCFTVEPTG